MYGYGWHGLSNPWRRLREMQRQMDRLFGRAGGPVAPAFPPMNVRLDENGAEVTAELPGVKPDDLDISVHDHTLTLKGHREPGEGEGTWHRRERAFGQFARSLQLPFEPDADNVEATCRDGVLKLRLHRSEADTPKKITVQS